jgi:hypothetical protein
MSGITVRLKPDTTTNSDEIAREGNHKTESARAKITTSTFSAP